MDLRKKASPIRRLGEILLRFRLILVAVFAVLYVVFARDFRAIFSYASAALKSAMESFGLDASFVTGAESLAVPVSVTGVLVFLVCFLLVRMAILKILLPALLVAFFWTALSASGNLPFAEYLAFLLAGFLGILIVGIFASLALKKGTPVAGALAGGFSKAFFPTLGLHLLLGGVFGYLFRADAEIHALVLFPFVSFCTFLLAEFPMLSFAPMGKLRAERRSMKI